jgi:copper chaperone CopZ
VPGVSGIDVDVNRKQVTVEHGNLLTREEIASAMDKAGFPNS